jgi:hypothetical protein
MDGVGDTIHRQWATVGGNRDTLFQRQPVRLLLGRVLQFYMLELGFLFLVAASFLTWPTKVTKLALYAIRAALLMEESARFASVRGVADRSDCWYLW